MTTPTPAQEPEKPPSSIRPERPWRVAVLANVKEDDASSPKVSPPTRWQTTTTSRRFRRFRPQLKPTDIRPSSSRQTEISPTR
jgi:hypothetical protein